MTKIVDVLLDEIKSRGYTIARFSRETGEHPAAITKRLYKAAEDVGKIDG